MLFPNRCASCGAPGPLLCDDCTLALAHGLRDLTVADGELRFAGDEAAVATLTVALGQARIGITGLRSEAASLEELFLELTEEAEAA